MTVEMNGSSDHKVQGGKFPRVRIVIERENENDRLVSVRIYGDFFMHPEEAVEEMEERIRLAGLDHEAVVEALRSFMKGDTVLFGAEASDIEEAFWNAVTDAHGK